MKKVNKTETQKPVMPLLKKMKIGEKISYPMQRSSTVKSVVCQVQVTTGMEFKTHLERPMFYVTRVG